jgi:hypothetical protein
VSLVRFCVCVVCVLCVRVGACAGKRAANEIEPRRKGRVRMGLEWMAAQNPKKKKKKKRRRASVETGMGGALGEGGDIGDIGDMWGDMGAGGGPEPMTPGIRKKTGEKEKKGR